MLRDLGSRDAEFIHLVRDIRQRLLLIGEVLPTEYTAVLLPGSGTYGVEAVLSSTVPPTGKLLLLVNGAYGQRMAQMAQVLKIPAQVLSYPEDQAVNPADVDSALADDATITHVAVVHCETTTGRFNPIAAIGEIVRRHERIYFVDAMSSFGGVPLALGALGIDYLVSSANKCIEGVPGFSFVLARRERLLATAGYARSLSFDLLAQYKGLESNGQFRFTPPTHALLAFHQALLELAAEGGVAARMAALGFQCYLPPEAQSHIITAFLYPTHPRFHFEAFYQRLSVKGYSIYPGKVSNANCFRIGSIGRIFPADVHGLLAAIRTTLHEMEIA
jgi:2-aminoethylphosphonate-pyruvate transaminase